MGWRFAIIGQAAQHQQQVFIGLHTIGLGRFHQRIYNGAGLRSLDAVAEQPILTPQLKGAGFLCQIIADRSLQKRR